MTRVGFMVGCGRSDITGEAAECGMLGYGKRTQRSAGIHLRLNARAFVFATDRGDQTGRDVSEAERILIVVAELPLIFDSLHRAVLDRLADCAQGRFTAANTMITATHTHCGPGGYSHHRMYNTTTHGFRPATFNAIVDGIVEAVERAEADLGPATVTLTQSELRDASANRSPGAFARNPAADRAHFPDAIDPLSSLLRIERGAWLAGAIHFFATHGTSMTNENKLISSDNKGYAAYSWERRLAESPELSGRRAPVLAFAQTNSGDMSPNLWLRPGHGPTADEVANTQLIGARQAASAADLAAVPAQAMPALLQAATLQVRFSGLTVSPDFSDDGSEHRTGYPCAGTSALAGAGADGHGFAGFREGAGGVLSSLLYRLRPRLAQTQAPKSVAVSGATLNRHLPFVAETAPVQLLRIGELYLLGVPAEVTIVAGLRLRRTVAGVLGVGLDQVLVCGYCNGYLHYVTTPQEYDEQRYEGGSTLFGRWELPALTQIAHELAVSLRDGRPLTAGVEAGVAPPTPPVHYRRRPDRRPSGAGFGDVCRPPRGRYRPGDRVSVAFVAANLNNDLRRGGTYLHVDRRSGDGWSPIADDRDFETMLRWHRRRGGASTVNVSWQIPLDVQPGEYRIVHYGTACPASVGDRSPAAEPFRAETPSFEVRASLRGTR